MCGSFYKRGKFAWVQDVRANFVCVHNGELAATVFSTEWEPWQIILHDDPWGARILMQEGFADPQAAMAVAEEMIDGTSTVQSNTCTLASRAFVKAFSK